MHASDLKQTVVVATPDVPIEPGTNVLWCGTFQLAWNQACDLIGEDIHLAHEPAMVAELNKKPSIPMIWILQAMWRLRDL